ncbi:MAG: PhnA domain-containing protein [Proteobacteria bacterium]|nr:PhnA domain-containing protein [Pseudomonadota bacterium]
MSTEQTLMQRSNSICELCGSDHGLSVYEVPPNNDASAEQAVLVCETCAEQINEPAKMDANHWRCLNDSMWNQEPAVQVMAWRLLTHLNAEPWAQDLLDMLYLEDDVKQWAQSMGSSDDDSDVVHKDSNGAILLGGDSVTLIKDLDVKGANFTAKRGTMVKNISLTDNPEQIEGRVNGTRIVLLTKFLKKA